MSMKNWTEKQISEAFDEEILPYVLKQYGPGDKIAVRTAFNDWTDALCKDGELSQEQYETFTYVGMLVED